MKYLLLPFAALLCSCSTFRKVQENIDYVSPASYLVAIQVLDKAVSGDDAVDKAEIIKSITDKVLTYTPDHKPTKEEFTDLIISSAPDKPHWVLVAGLIGQVYERYTTNIKEDDVTAVLVVIKAIAQGLNDAAEVYIK